MITEISAAQMVILITKLIHIAAVALWVGGLVSLPYLLVQTRYVNVAAPERLHRFVRFLHITIVSPAAFVAVAAGIALIFLREIYFVWFSAKLYLVAVLVICHVRIGQLIISSFESERQLGRRPATLLSGTVALSALGILYFVLSKRNISLDAIAGESAEPGWLENSFVAPIISVLLSWTR